jgi:H/ACA ribonucleoprotein complex subunit 4
MMPASKPPWEIRKKVLIKAEEDLDPKYGRRPQERPIEDYIRFGIINLDKTSGPSSHETAAWLKRVMKIAQAGHGGTLETSVSEVKDILE